MLILSFVKIGVGSEMACMLNPDKYWVGNVRTFFAGALVKNEWDWLKAEKLLKYYKDEDANAEYKYTTWKALYIDLEKNLNEIYTESVIWTKTHKKKIGKHKYLWVDAICSQLYNEVS